MRKIFLCFSVLFISLPAQAGLLDIKEVTSPGGIKAWLVEDHSIPVLAIDFGFAGAGSALDPKDKQGLARMVSNTMDEGAGDLDSKAFQKELQNLVISFSFDADRDSFSGSLKTLSKNKDRAFELAALAITKPRFDQEAVDRMRAANQARVRSSMSEPDWMAARVLNDKAFEGHPYALNSGGTLSSLKKISAKDLKAFHKTMLGKNNLMVAASGDITPEELGKKLDEIFGALPEVKVPEVPKLELQNQGKIFLYTQDIPQSVVEIIQPGINRKDPQYQIAQVMNFVLGSSGFGSRLTKEIREKRGLTYGIYSYLYNLDHLDALSVSSSTANENAEEMLGLIKTEFDRMAMSPITDKELADAKSYLVGSLPLSLTSTDKIAGLLLSLQMDGLPIDYLDVREREITATSVADVSALSKKLLSPEHFVTVLVGKPEGITKEAMPNLEIIKTLPNVE
jgi:zinc protease